MDANFPARHDRSVITPRRFVHLLAAPLLVTALAACTSSTPAASPTPVSSAPVASPSGTISAAEAGEKLMHYRPAGPEGSHLLVSAVLDLDGTVDTIFGSAAPDAKAEVKSQFTQRGFVVAMRHAWTAPDGTQSFTVLMRFSDDAGAEGMASRLAEGLKSTYPDTVFTDPGDLSTGAVVNIDDHGKALVELVAPHGDVVVFMNYLTPAAPDKKTALVRFHSHLTMLPTPGLPWQ